MTRQSVRRHDSRRWPSVAVVLWSVLGLFVAVVLLGYSVLDTGAAGDLGSIA